MRAFGCVGADHIGGSDRRRVRSTRSAAGHEGGGCGWRSLLVGGGRVWLTQHGRHFCAKLGDSFGALGPAKASVKSRDRRQASHQIALGLPLQHIAGEHTGLGRRAEEEVLHKVHKRRNGTNSKTDFLVGVDGERQQASLVHLGKCGCSLQQNIGKLLGLVLSD